MAITPAPGWMIDPNNPNGVIPIGSAATVNNPNANYYTPATTQPVDNTLNTFNQNLVTGAATTVPSNATSWNLSAWNTTGQGTFSQAPTLTINGQPVIIGSPQQGIDLLQQLKSQGNTDPNLDLFISQFQKVLPEFTAKPVTTLTSSSGKELVNQNTQSLSNTENSLAGRYSVVQLPSGNYDILENGQSVSQGGPGWTKGQLDTMGYGSLIGGSVAADKMASEISAATSQGNLTSQEQQGLTALKATQDGLVAAAAQARAALNSKDYSKMDFYTQRAEALQQQYADQLAQYYKDTSNLRAQYTATLTPGAKEQDLQKQLADVKNQAAQFKLQTEEDKFNEFQGQTLGFAGGRAAEIDIRASFKNQEFALEQTNLLTELGLEQDARELQGKSIEQQMTWLSEDYELQQKVQDKITALEDQLFEQADKLEQEAKDTLMTMLDALQGTNPDDLSPELKSQIETIAARANLPTDLVYTALKTQYQKQVFDQAIQSSQESRLAASSEDAGAKTLEERNREASSSMANEMNTVADINGFVTPKDYALAKRAWVSAGYNSADFDKQFATYRDPNEKYLTDE